MQSARWDWLFCITILDDLHIRERAALERASQLASLMGDPEICEAIRALAEESEKCGAAMGG